MRYQGVVVRLIHCINVCGLTGEIIYACSVLVTQRPPRCYSTVISLVGLSKFDSQLLIASKISHFSKSWMNFRPCVFPGHRLVPGLDGFKFVDDNHRHLALYRHPMDTIRVIFHLPTPQEQVHTPPSVISNSSAPKMERHNPSRRTTLGQTNIVPQRTRRQIQENDPTDGEKETSGCWKRTNTCQRVGPSTKTTTTDVSEQSDFEQYTNATSGTDWYVFLLDCADESYV